ncbi:rhamnulokinase [Marinitenerispora sediminis]|uniref:Rhamnulokinase n=1 Tax=Marinitenerispora sediminis TaxID=1931232 RepID=A0A368T990_9ACTN|nr:rhamnulokinase family protein [Marinitenerispora sediminis]RCV53532.1 rhamnulokinase [Marinitenerispora sediminis]RCV57688.1 rhamnulokinase [Marinitenerispora sediminis]RCV60755.1 rhamnulokinase [Marinitenerispora sediminis]
MADELTFAAVDLGASSGRVVVGRVGPGVLRLTEAHRFRNEPVRLPDGLHWDVTGLYREVLHGLSAAAPAGPVSIGVDSWAVDYGLLDASGALLGVPYHYRDSRTDAVAPRVVAEAGADALYAANGLQYLPFNTIFQLAAAAGTAQLAAARTLLLIPDLLGYWLTGERGAELTNASTTGLLDAGTRTWSPELAAVAGIDPALLPAIREPGSAVGPLLPEVAAETGLAGVSVTAVASHDTASAVIGVPASSPDFGYISCGTWSLAGLELPRPVRTAAARAANFTNELGIDGSTRFLRNTMGLWLVQETLRAWRLDTDALRGLLGEAARAEPFTALIDPDDGRFLPPGDMPARISAFCRETGQPAPESRGALLRCVLESLALAHRRTIRTAAALADRDVREVHLVGGGARNELLCQLTADALDLPVLAGPVEATAIGNVLVQARTAGAVPDLAAMRALTAATQPLRRYTPSGDRRSWESAAARLERGGGPVGG